MSFPGLTDRIIGKCMGFRAVMHPISGGRQTGTQKELGRYRLIVNASKTSIVEED